MKPRIFVSSTFYDLKYIREDLSNYIKAHDFEPILFEDGDIGYTPGKPLDESCYENMKTADMVILIIGGNYGSPASGEKEDAFNEYMSVTRKEFSTAVTEGIPIYAFVESAVFAEYGVYDCNIKKIENRELDISFKATKNINVFRFIREIYSLGKVSVTEFKKPSEIKDFLSKQWSDMFKNYLKLLKEKNESEHLYDAMDNLHSLIKRMDIMVNGLGKKIIGHEDNISYDEVLKEQTKIRAREFAKKICDGFSFNNNSQIERNEAIKIAYSLIKAALCDIRLSQESIDFNDPEQIIDVVDNVFSSDDNIHLVHGSLFLFRNWETYIEICDNQELDNEILYCLENENWGNKLFAKPNISDDYLE